MKQKLRPLFWIEALLALGNAVLLLMTLLWKDWIEIVFRVDPDAGSGAVEWLIVGVTLLLTIAFLALARTEWRRTATQRS
ncbi:MAG TPA: ABC transporter permease [Chloroflexota bacterium]